MKYGTNYNGKLDTKDIAALIRQKIKEAVKSGSLPKAKYSVRMDRFAGGSSIDVTIKEPSFAILNSNRIELEVRDPSYQWRTYDSEPRYTNEASETTKKIEQLLASYNFDDSDISTDYFHVNFYGHVKFDWKEEQAEHERVQSALNSGQAVA